MTEPSQSKPPHPVETAAPVDAAASARRTVETEMAGLRALRDGLNGDFTAAVAMLEAVRGRIVVSGMGKSGHIARKIAATLASTGSPAQFVHPAEAGHGDLGMITPADAVIALSNSGNTVELAAIIAYTRRFGIPLIAITGGADSLLAEAADLVLLLPAAPEACPMGLAPTTSTTMTLALGDALAVALLERRGFSRDDFQIYHPGGSLGQRLVRVADIMHTGAALPLCRPDTRMSDAILTMTAHGFGVIGITEGSGEGGGGTDGRLIGVITDGDLRRHMAPTLLEETAGAVMTADPRTISPRILGAEALKLMNGYRITVLFAVEDGRPVGLVRMHDLLRAGVA